MKKERDQKELGVLLDAGVESKTGVKMASTN